MKHFIKRQLDGVSDRVKRTAFVIFLLLVSILIVFAFKDIEYIQGQALRIDGLIIGDNNRGFQLGEPDTSGMQPYNVISCSTLFCSQVYFVKVDKKSEFDFGIAKLPITKGLNRIYVYFNRVEVIDSDGELKVFRNPYVENYYSDMFSDLNRERQLFEEPEARDPVFRKDLSIRRYLERVKLFTVYLYVVMAVLLILVARKRAVHLGFLFLIAAMIKDIDLFTLSLFNQLDLILLRPVTALYPIVAMSGFSILLLSQIYYGFKNIRDITFYDTAIIATTITLTTIIL